jgi:hypothetical protein
MQASGWNHTTTDDFPAVVMAAGEVDEGWRDENVEAEIRVAAKEAQIHAQDEGNYEEGNIFR